MKVRDIASIIERYAPLGAQENYDNAGMQVGCLDDTVKGILLCTDVTPDIVDEAINGGYNLIVSHHPLIFHALKKIVGRTIVESIVAQAIKHDINIYCAHTNMDNVQGGVSFRMAAKLGMTDVEILDPKNPAAAPAEQVGSGVIGNVKPMAATQMLKLLKDTFEVEAVRYSGDTSGMVSRIALCGGAGGFLVGKAIEAGAHMYVSADLRYNDLIDNNRSILLADIGHYESEHYTKEIFYELIMAHKPDCAVDFAKKETNQIKFYI
ncbi:MAG: Nif3-like dinuclear metal center hexameric protein [Muribaculaceae bacterium]|nr:Nif3-like dinuclear metal center hexameric protein [Muribaculaceae bacterium]